MTWYSHKHLHSHGHDTEHRHDHSHKRENHHRAINSELGGELAPQHQHSHSGDSGMSATPAPARVVHQTTEQEQEFLNLLGELMEDDGKTRANAIAEKMSVTRAEVVHMALALRMGSYINCEDK